MAYKKAKKDPTNGTIIATDLFTPTGGTIEDALIRVYGNRRIKCSIVPDYVNTNLPLVLSTDKQKVSKDRPFVELPSSRDIVTRKMDVSFNLDLLDVYMFSLGLMYQKPNMDHKACIYTRIRKRIKTIKPPTQQEPKSCRTILLTKAPPHFQIFENQPRDGNHQIYWISPFTLFPKEWQTQPTSE